MKKEPSFDYIICGGGASGLLLTQALVNDSFFIDKKILLIEKEHKTTNDRTWCFWEKEKTNWDLITHKKWSTAKFNSSKLSKSLDLFPFQYKMLRGIDFYNTLYKELADKLNLIITQDKVLSINDKKTEVQVIGNNTNYLAKKVFSSIPVDTNYLVQKKYPVLQQHFIGWIVQTEFPIFDPTSFHFMDFNLPQKGNTRFMYILPFSKNKALVEYTLFSADLLKKEEYETAITEYLNVKNAGELTILEKEQGNIPMTCYPFWKNNTQNIMYIGTAGGWTKASTGFTFQKTQQQIQKLIPFIKQNKPLNKFKQKNRFWFYDLLFLDVLSRHNEKGGAMFSAMFRKNSANQIFKFLGEETTFLNEVKILFSFPISLFLKALWKRIFKL